MGRKAKALLMGIMKRYADAVESICIAVGEYVTEATAEVTDALAEGFRKVFYAAKEAVEIINKKLADAWEKTKERIQTMSEEEYAEFLEELTPEARGWAAAIRAGGKKNDTGN